MYGTELQQEWVHLFYHTLDIIPMNWSLEIEIFHDTAEWNILREGFLMTFSFKGRFKSIDEALQEVKAVILRITQDPLELVKLDLSTHLRHALECYNMIVEGEYEDPQNINISEAEGHHEVEGL